MNLKWTTAICCLALFIRYANGQCLENRIIRNNNTIWKKDSCTLCSCNGDIINCITRKCKDPQCDSTKGESLIFPANKCCPTCTETAKRPCEKGGEIIAHGTQWKGDNCTKCHCNNGATTCSDIVCESLQCGYGETEKWPTGKCCPTCASIDKPCEYEEKSYLDGEIWSPSKCERAQCSKGEVIRYIAKCDALICGAGENAVVLDNECCPSCVGRSCVYEGREYKDKEQFKDGACRSCVCESGEVKCTSKRCVTDEIDVGCPPGMTRVTRSDECCSECVSSQEPCDYQGVRHYHGDLWNISRCEVAVCSHGNVRSIIPQCSPVECKWNERESHTSCCPECVPVTSSCRHNGFEYRHGDKWQGGACTRCECVFGMTQCFVADCQACPVDTVPVNVPGECCPDCQPVSCHSDCVTCSAPGYAHCTSCKPKRFLQEGKCVRRCQKGFYQNGNICQPCHSTCASCTLGNSPSACTSCDDVTYLQEGQCVRDCGLGYHRQGRQCIACPKGCGICLNSTQCVQCRDRTRAPQAGMCVQNCGEGYYYSDGMCKACHHSCATCSVGPNICDNCPVGSLMENGLCVEDCSPGYFQISISRCSACHSTCTTCTGSLANQCVTCGDLYLLDGRCVAQCPISYYINNGRCAACHSSCQSCNGPTASQCLACKSRDLVIQSRRGSSSGTCQETCTSGYYLEKNYCKKCHTSCSECYDYNHCSSCNSTSFQVTSPGRDQHCVTRLSCSKMSLSVDDVNSLCTNADEIGRCSAGGEMLYNSNCVEECPQGTYAKVTSFGRLCLECDEGCDHCRDFKQCVACGSGTFLSRMSGKCVGVCEDGYYAAKNSGTCQMCPSSCATCTTTTSSPQPMCTSCSDVRAVLQMGQCVAYCVQQFYEDIQNSSTPVCRECDWTCSSCDGPTSRDCLECMPDYKLQEGMCVESCSEGYFLSGDTCAKCKDTNCNSCNGPNHCSACTNSYHLFENKCMSSCPRGYYFDQSNSACLPCSSHCLECTDASTCLQCDSSTFLIEDLGTSENELDHRISRRITPHLRSEASCIRHCGRGYYGDKHARRCEVNRHAPLLDSGKRLLVGIGSRVLLNDLRVSDKDTTGEFLSIKILMTPGNGWLELNDERLSSGSKIPYDKVTAGSLWFVHDPTAKRHGVASFQATDRQLESNPVTIEITAISNVSPVVTMNEPIFVKSGETVKITASNFQVRDDDNSNDVTVTIIYPPTYGDVVRLPNYDETITSLNIEDLKTGVILYVSHGNVSSDDVIHDTITFQISDGYHVINKALQVNIIPGKHAGPRLIMKDGIHVRRGGMVRITNQQLQTIGTNVKDNSKIVYVIRPKEGRQRGEVIVMLLQDSPPPNQFGISMEEWMRSREGMYLSPPMIRFSQRDVDQGVIWYRDLSEEEEDYEVEAFEFEVYDETREPSQPIASDEFRVHVVPDNVQPPRLSRGMASPPEMFAIDGDVTVLHNGYLHYTDEDTSDRNLIINVTRPLPVTFGTLEHTDRPHVPITLFTQADVNANKIIYRPPNGGIPSVLFEQGRLYESEDDLDGKGIKYDHYQALTDTASNGSPQMEFEFTVSDGDHTLNPVNFTIQLVTGTTSPPVFVNSNPTLEVEQGRMAFIGDAQLDVRDPDTSSGDLIFTLVKEPLFGTLIRNDDGTRMILTEGDVFTYPEVQSESLTYVHEGGDENGVDQIQISVRDTTNTATTVIQVFVYAAEDTGISPDPNSELSLVVSESSETVLTEENLAYVDGDVASDKIVYMLKSEPTNGLLESELSGPLIPGATFTQKDINDGRIRFHSGTGNGLQDIVLFKVLSVEGRSLDDQTLSITITTSQQHPPVVSVGGELVVRSNQAQAMITPAEIIATDSDTPKYDLIINVVENTKYGQLINTLDEERNEADPTEYIWFSMQDILDGGIYYVPRDDAVAHSASDYFTFQVTDGQSSSEIYRLNISIEPSDNKQPALHTATIVCQNGHAIIIRNGSLVVIDPDTSSDDLVFTVTSQLRYGKLVKLAMSVPHGMENGWKTGMMKKDMEMGMKSKQETELRVGATFTYQDVLDNKICYEAQTEDVDVFYSRGRRDTLGFTLSDGSHNRRGELEIDIEPDPEDANLRHLAPPLYEELEEDEDEFDKDELMGADDYEVEVNTGITVEKGSSTIISAENLLVRSTVYDHVASFVITRDPNVGQLQYADEEGIINLSADSESEFSQDEIDNGYIRYVHPVAQGGGDIFFMFDVIGGMVDLRFNIRVNDDNLPPRIITNEGLVVKEGGHKKITTRQLSATDESGRIHYDVTIPPKLGRLEFTDEPGFAISGFTQDDLISGTVQYVHNSDTERTEDEFTFSLTDETNSIIQSFYITVLPVDNSLPVLENKGIRVQEGVRKTITEFELKATDKDTTADHIAFRIVEQSQHGTVERTETGKRHVPVTSFTMDDIYEGRISYNHDGTNSLTDQYTFTVSDGTNGEFLVSEEGSLIPTTSAQIFTIQVVPVDDGTPRIITNLGLNHLEYMDDKAMSVITKRSLLTEDPDTTADMIIYSVTSLPRHGRLESNQKAGTPIQSFTQADINLGVIRYVLDDVNSAVTRDSFMFTVRDSLPNVVTGNTFNIRWSVISFDKSNYTVNEEAGTVDINVIRRGNLNQYAIVHCRTESATATSTPAENGRNTGNQDYMDHTGQVQFDEHEVEKTCTIQINDDTLYEGIESFIVELTSPTYALLGNLTRATVYIDDKNDIPTVQFIETQYTVEERDTFVFIPIKRTGDVEKAITVMCYTESHTAQGSVHGRIESGSDLKSRGRYSGESIITFEPGVTTQSCDVRIIDDSAYEDAEEFKVIIEDSSEGSKIGKFSEATVTITGPNDAPTVFLTESKFVFSENAGTVDIPVHRNGPDLSRDTDVWCSTKQNDPVSAVAAEDFVATSTKITFRHEETAKICSLTILDDSQSPKVEGNETFVVYLNSVQRAKLIAPHEALVVINDTLDDVPKFEFTKSSVSVKENAGHVSLPVQRVGDVTGRASVICFTRQMSATVDNDFTERPLTEMSRIEFGSGQSLNFCNVTLIDDEIYESNENFVVRLASAVGDEWYGARVGENDEVQVTVTNNEDAPTLEFESIEYSIREPTSVEGSRQLTVTVVRTGDVSEISKVRCSTRDGSAKSGSDYEPKSRLLRFKANQSSVTFQVNILSNEDTEWHETFLIVLGSHNLVNAELGIKSQTTVTILDKDASGSLVLPSTPIVVSLLDYDDVGSALERNPSPGYPLICVTPCDPKYPHYLKTRNLCEEAAINASAIRFSWEVAMPSDEKQGIPPFEAVTDTTPFTSVNTKVLDSIYFGRRFHVRCIAQAVDMVTQSGGTPLKSGVATIATDTGMCHNPIVSGTQRNFQAQSFIANLRYIPPDAEERANTIHISVKIPHQDGRLPLISTMPFNNLKLLLSRSIDRQQHVCSNLMYSGEENSSTTSPNDITTTGILADQNYNLGFIGTTDYSAISLGPGFDKPYQFDPNVREAKTIDLYKYLNLKSCVWQFDAYYHMDELIDYCNGKVHPDFQLRDAAASQVTVTVPLYVSYVYVTAPRGWGALDHHTEMEFSFRYSNVLWKAGIQTDGALTGRIQVTRVKTQEDGKLLVEFKTQAKFRGLFVLNHRTLPGKSARVAAPEGMSIGFELTNIRSERTYDSPYQYWRAVSTYSRKDYSGEYTVELLPCTVSPTQQYEVTPAGRTMPCTAYSPEKFPLLIMFQQTNRPVPVVYTLQTEFQLCNNENVFMKDPKKYELPASDYDYKGSFTKGQTIFGRVLWTPDQDLKSAYRLQLEKVYLCTGRDGNIPYFDPTGSIHGDGPQYGCIEPSKKLQHRFLLLDRSNRDAEDRYFHDVPFEAYFASDRPQFSSMSDITGVDGFLIKVDALYKVEAGHQWYLQVLYVIGSDDLLPRVKRSAMFGLADPANKRKRRSERYDYPDSDDSSIAGWRQSNRNKNGTNMVGIKIDQTQSGLSTTQMAGVAAGVLFALVFAAICLCCFVRRRRKRTRKDHDFEMVGRKTAALEAGDGDYWEEKKFLESDVVGLPRKNSKAGALEKNQQNCVRVSNVNLCETSQLKTTCSKTKQNNNSMTSSSKPLLKRSRRKNLDTQIVNNLKRNNDDSGTEV